MSASSSQVYVGKRVRSLFWRHVVAHAVLLASLSALVALAGLAAGPRLALGVTGSNPPTVAYAMWSHIWMSDDDGDALSVTGGTGTDDVPRVGDTLTAQDVDPSKFTYRYQRYKRDEQTGSLQPEWVEVAYETITERGETPRLWYTWYRGSSVAKEGRDPSYTVTTADIGKVLSLEVSDKPWVSGDTGFSSQKSATDHLYTVGEIAATGVVDPGAAIGWSAGDDGKTVGMWQYLSGTTLHLAEAAAAPDGSATTVEMSYAQASSVPWNSSRGNITDVALDTDIYPASVRYWFDDMTKLAALDLRKVQPGKMGDGEGVVISGATTLSSVTFAASLANRTATIGGFTRANYTTKGWRKAQSGNAPQTSVTISAGTFVPVLEGTYAVLASNTLTFFKGTADGNVASGGAVTKAKNLAGTQYTGTLYTGIATWTQGSNASDGYGVPWYGQRTSIKTVAVSGTASNAAHKVAPTNMYHWFDGCANLETVTLSALFDTSGVTTMAGLFKGCSKLSTLDLSNFSVGNVVDFAGMFEGCTALGNGSNKGITFPSGGISASGKNIANENMRLHFPSYTANDTYSGKWIPSGSVTPIYDGASSMADVTLAGQYVRQPALSAVTFALGDGAYTSEQVAAMNALVRVSATGSGTSAVVVASVPANGTIGSVFSGTAFAGDIPTPTRVGYVFESWKVTLRDGSPTAGDAGVTKVDATITKDSGFDAGIAYTITAQWRAKRYSLVVDPNGGTMTARDGNFSLESVPQTFTTATKLVDVDHPKNNTKLSYGGTNFYYLQAGFVREGYYFDGLWDDQTAGKQVYSDVANYPRSVVGSYWSDNGSNERLCYDGVDGSTITVYAHWTPIRKVALDLQGGTATDPANGSATPTQFWYRQGVAGHVYSDATCATEIDLATSPIVAIKKDYAFRGYYSQANGGGTKYVNEDGTPTAALYGQTAATTSIYAKWELGEANWAFYSAADNSLNFVYSAPALVEGGTFEVDGTNKRIDAAYAGEGADGWLTTAYANAASVPWYAQRANVGKTVFYAVTKPAATAYWFAGLAGGSVTELDLTKLDTTGATDLTGMFDGLSALKSVKLDASFRFAGTGGVAAAKRALLPTPSGEGYTGRWVNETDAAATASAVAYAPADLANPSGGFDGLAEPKRVGTWVWSRGYAYAAVTDAAGTFNGSGNTAYTANTLVFFRSESVYANATTYAGGSGNSFADVKGNHYTGIVYTGFETGAYTSSAPAPWRANCDGIVAITVAHGQKIHPENTAYWFHGTYMSDTMCYAGLRDVDLSGLDMSGVTSAAGMFADQRGVTSLDVPSWGWDTSGLRDMTAMFSENRTLTSLDLSGWDTSNVTTMHALFSGCTELVELDVAGWNTANATDMYMAFNYCSKLPALDLSGWDTTHVTNMGQFFDDCPKLQSVKLGANFRFRGTNSGDIASDTAKQAVFPAPAGADVTGRWLNTGAAGTDYTGASYVADGLRDGFDGMDEPARVGTWVWERYHTVTLDPGAATTAGSTVVYVRHDGGAYRSYADGVLAEPMSTTANAITAPEGGPLLTFNGTGGVVGTEPIHTMRPGSAFAGYYLGETRYIDDSGHATSALNGTTVTADTTLSVRWDDVTVAQPTPTRAGYVFAGWVATRGATGGATTGDHSANVDVTRYATWTRDDDAAVWDTAYSGDVVEFRAPATALYRLEAWGAMGGGRQPGLVYPDNVLPLENDNLGGHGGYSVGLARLSQGQTVYVVVGQYGNAFDKGDLRTSSFNGGGATGKLSGAGGGMTHFSLTSNIADAAAKTWSPAGTLLVAGGGGGSDNANRSANVLFAGGVGGGAEGADGAGQGNRMAEGGKQQSSGSGLQGVGATGGHSYATGGNGGGGGGWWGGGARADGETGQFSGAGGSGFVATQAFIDAHVSRTASGPAQAQSVMEDGDTYDGGQTFASPAGADEVGHVGNGYARITRLAVASFDKNAEAATGTMTRQILVYKVQDTLKTNGFRRTHYDFLGWNTDGAAAEASYANESGITLAADTTLHAIWQAHTYTLTLHTNGGTVASGWTTVAQASEYRRNHTVAMGDVTIPTPTRTGYTLVGWSTDATTTKDDFDADTAEDFAPGVRASEWLAAHESDLTLYAVWRAHTFTVHYRDGSTSADKDSSNHTYDTASTLTTAQALGLASSGTTGRDARAGWTFVGWLAGTQNGVAAGTDTTYDNGADAIRLTSVDEDDIYLYAVWKRNATFWYGATGEATSSSAEQRWNPSAGTPGTGVYTLATLDARDDLGTGDDKWSFVGWRTNGSAAGAHDVEADSPYAGAENAFYAAYTRTATFTSGENGAQHPTAPQYYCTGGGDGAVGTWSVVVPSVTKPDNTWTHAGWREDADADVPTVKNGSSVVTTGTITANVGPAFNAVWTRTATFKKGYDTTAGTPTQRYNSKGDAYAVVAPGNPGTYDGPDSGDAYHWAFQGWTDVTGEVSASTQTGSTASGGTYTGGAQTLYALYNRTPQVRYQPNGGSGTVGNTTATQQWYRAGGVAYPSNVRTDLPDGTTANAFTKTGYTVTAWLEDGASGTERPLGSTNFSFDLARDENYDAKQMFAKWTANSFTVVYHDGGSAEVESSTHTYDTESKLTAATTSSGLGLARDGWDFAGWREAASDAANPGIARDHADEADATRLTTTPNDTVHLYAVWKRDVKFYNGDKTDAASSSIVQYWNPLGDAQTSVTRPALTALTASSPAWTAVGWATTTDPTTTKAFDASTAVDHSHAATYYALYRRSVDFYYDGNHLGSAQYKNNAGKAAHAYMFSDMPSPASSLGHGWSFVGWNSVQGDASAPAIAANSLQHSSTGASTFYGVYGRTPQLSYAGNDNTGGQAPDTVDLAVQYLATDDTTTTWASAVSVVAATHGLTRTGYSPTAEDGHVTYNTKADGSGATYVATVAKDWQPTKDQDKDIVLHAQWTPNQYVATFLGNNNTSGGKPQVTSPSGIVVTDVATGADARATATLTYDVTYTIVNYWERAGYTFGGWNFGGIDHTTNTNTVSLLYNVANAAEVRAIWNANTITLTLTSDLATTSAGDGHVYYVYDTEAYFRTKTGANLSGQMEAISRPSASGYAFEGYYTATHGDGTRYIDRNGAFVNNPYRAVTADTTLNAKWSYQVSYDANGGTGTVTPTTGVYGKNVKLAAGTGLTAPTGYEFKGWATSRANANRGTVAYDGGATRSHTDFSSGNAKLYAVWGRTVTFKWGAGATQSQTGTQYAGRTSDADGTPAYYLELPSMRDTITATGGNLLHCGWRSSANAGSATLGAPDVAAVSGTTALALDGTTLFAVYSRNVSVRSGVNRASTENRTQYYTCHGALTANVYHLMLPAPSHTDMDAAGIDWAAYGWNVGTTANTATIAREGTGEQLVNAPINSNKLNAVYARTAEVAYDRDATATGATASGGTTSNSTVDYQYYNSEGNATTTVAMRLADNGFHTATGYHFVRWSVAGSFVANGLFVEGGDYGYHQGVGDVRVVTAKATYAPNTVAVAFGDGGSETWPATLGSGLAVRETNTNSALEADGNGRFTLTYNVTYTLTGTIARPYFTFRGWRSQDETAEPGTWTYEWDGNVAGGGFDALVRNVSSAHEQDVDVDAVWERNTYDVSYLPGTYGVMAGGTSAADTTLNAGDSYTTSTAEDAGITPKPGYRFAGWSVAIAGGTGSALAGGQDGLGGGMSATIEATGGNGAGSTFVATYGHGLVGTDTDGATVTLTALWLPRAVTVAFDPNGNASLPQADTTITTPATREGTVGLPLGNAGANLVAGGGDVLPAVAGTGASAAYVEGEDAEVLGGRAVGIARTAGGSADATWTYTAKGLTSGRSYVVTLLARGTGSWSATLGGVSVLAGATPASVGYAPLTATVVAASSGDAPLVLRASGTDAAMLRLAAVTVQEGTLSALPTVTRVGYAFDAWYTDAPTDAGTRVDGVGSGGLRSVVAPVSPADDQTTYYAHWTPNTYEVRFDPNGSHPKGPVVEGEELELNRNTPVEGTMPAQQMTYDHEEALEKSLFERQGYDFLGWNTQADGQGTKFAQFAVEPYGDVYTYADEERVVNFTATEAYVTLYAQWRQTNVAGSAYAVFADDGSLTFFRSEQQDVVGSGKTAVDIAGGVHTGDIYAIDESSTDDPYAAVGDVPWASRMRQLRRVRVADYAPGVGGDKQLVSPVSMGHWFDGADGVVAIDLEGVDTSRVTNMDGLFAGCSGLASGALDFGSNFVTSATTSMVRMFAGATALATLDVRGWDTSKVESMESMFEGCTALATISPITDHAGEGEPLSTVAGRAWATGSVTSMRRMFAGCVALNEVNVSGWDVSAVESMESMFDGCTELQTLSFTTFTNRTDNVIDTSATKWSTPAVTNVANMMRGCARIGSLDLRTFDTSHATNLGGMFAGCSRLSLVHLGPTFTFRGAVEPLDPNSLPYGQVDDPTTRMALLPEPPADSIYSGDWTYTTNGGNAVVGVVELRDLYLEAGSPYQAGTYMWAHFLPVAGGAGENLPALWAASVAVAGGALTARRRRKRRTQDDAA